MNTNCQCGGRFKRTDFVPIKIGKFNGVRDTSTDVSTWKCNKCDQIRTQRKRKGKNQKTVWQKLAEGTHKLFSWQNEEGIIELYAISTPDLEMLSTVAKGPIEEWPEAANDILNRVCVPQNLIEPHATINSGSGSGGFWFDTDENPIWGDPCHFSEEK